MSSFTSFIPGFDANMERPNPSRKRPAQPSRLNDFEVAQHSQRSNIFFTDEDDRDSLFGGDDFNLLAEKNAANRPSQPQNQSPRGALNQNRRNSTSGANLPGRNITNGRNGNLNNQNATRRPVPTTRAPPTPTRTNPETIQIKDEETETDTIMDAEYLRTIPPNQRVKIFVGRKNRSIHIKLSDLSKSPTLQSYVVDDPVQGAFIMRPQLMTTHYDDFAAVAQFLRGGEYAPLLLANEGDTQGPKVLSGLKSDEDYAKELVRSGKLYGLAKGFGIQGMAELVFKKVREVDAGKYSVSSLVKIAEIVFKDGKDGVEAAGGGGAARSNSVGEAAAAMATDGGGTDNKDPLEEWIIGKLAYNFQEIMRIQREKFFDVVKITRKKILFARVLEEVAGEYRASGGRLPEPVIELD